MQHSRFALRTPGRTGRSLLISLTLIACGFWLAGCGGGSAAVGGSGGGTTKSAVTGKVLAPGSQTKAAKVGARTRDALEPVAGANVSLISLDTGNTVATTTTDASGNYSFPDVTPGKDYEVQATKTVSSGTTLTLSAVVTAPPAGDTGSNANAPAQRNLDPDTTVATQAAKDEVAQLKQADPTATSTNLQAIAEELEKKRKDNNAPSPDLTKPAEVAAASTTLIQDTAPDGTYFGNFIGDNTGKIAALIKGGKFFVLALPDANTTNNGSTTNSSSSTGNNGANGGTGDQTTGGNGGNGNGNGNSQGHGDQFVFGTVSTGGVLVAESKGGVKIKGLFVGGVGTGTWEATSDKGIQKGTWKLVKQKDPMAGLYAGHHDSPSGGATQNGGNNTGNGGNGGNGNGNGGNGGSGVFAIMITDDHKVFIVGGSASELQPSIAGTGSVDNSGKVTFTVTGGHGNTIVGTGQITGDDITGTYTDGNQTGTWNGSRARPFQE